jgi:transposase
MPGVSLTEPKPLFVPVKIANGPASPPSVSTPPAAASPLVRTATVAVALRNGRVVRAHEGIEPGRLACLVASARGDRVMITVPAGVRIYLAMGPTDMRKGFDGLSMLVQEVLKLDPFSGLVRIPWPSRWIAESSLLGRPGLLLVRQALRERAQEFDPEHHAAR